VILLFLVAAVLGAAPDTPTCATASGQTACGYGCKTANGRAKCAQTPQGVCTVHDGQVRCFDPPRILSQVMDEVPVPECKVAQGKSVCGYNCSSARCASTPAGICQAQVCFDPPDEVFAVWGDAVPPPKCLAQGGRVACGYGCVAGSGSVACAKTPIGVCFVKDGTARCFDPASGVLCANGKDLERPACLEDFGQIACGYDCKSTNGKVACAQTPRGSCNDASGSVTCFDPPIDPGESTACFRATKS
jgi:hypothetical protein